MMNHFERSDKRKWSLARASLAIFTLALFIGAFQNCSKLSANQADATQSSKGEFETTGPGNGGSYDGKLYVNRAVGLTCANGASYPNEIVERNGDGKTFLMKKNCEPVYPPQEISGEIINPTESFGPSLRLYQNRVFDYAGPVYDGKMYSTLAYCRQPMGAAFVSVTIAAFVSSPSELQAFLQDTQPGQYSARATPATQSLIGDGRRFTTATGDPYPMRLDIFSFAAEGAKEGALTFVNFMSKSTVNTAVTCYTQ